MQGQWNSNLNDLGRQQADQHGQMLRDKGIEHLFVSPLDRTRQTAEILNRHLALPVTFDDRIMEWDCGDWSGRFWDELIHEWPEEFASWRADEFNYRGPNCENYPDMIQRAGEFLAHLSTLDLERIAVVSHGMIGRVLVGVLLDMAPAGMLGFHQTNNTIFHLSRTRDGWTTRHYVGPEGPFDGLPARPPPG